uniref:acyl-CoA thioester hydrolase/BAAT C-terminal domain-containing protein n=1 Tax=Pedobacter schmidteae TaxID=2201271 RepID=UPI000EB2880B|nr:acyl-CoA thioester hydrolase/BAAT C-terminal domain-containing protein [Pedobacter schmidteae]
MNKKYALYFILCFCSIVKLKAQENKAVNSTYAKTIWPEISPFFEPPAEFKGDYGDFRSPLKFYNGKPVQSAAQWPARRKEILDRWTTLMGKWPPFLTEQKMQVLDTVRKEGFTQHRVKFKWTPNEWTEGYLSVPDGKGKKPAVITVFYEPESAIGQGKEGRDFALQLTKRGFITLSLGTTAASKAQTYSIYYPDITKAEIQPLSALGYAAANAWYALSKVPDVDAKRIGIMGHSFGGKWAMFASCLFEKFACAVWSDPGIVFDESREAVNYWEPWYLGYYPKPWRKRGMMTPDNPAKGLYLNLVKEGYDLHELHALMAPRPFLVSAGSEDPLKRWVPLNHSIKVNNLLGLKNRVAMTNRPLHAPNDESNRQAFLFFTYFLKPDRLTL